jgi:hypothetical protein
MSPFGSSPQLRSVRIGAIVLLLLAGAAFHHRGNVYLGIRIGYYVLIVGALAAFAWRRWARERAQRAPLSDWSNPTTSPPAQRAPDSPPDQP